MAVFKCISVSQPFAHLIVSGKKTIELRSWNTKFRGDILIHSPVKVRHQDCKRLHLDCHALPTGAIVGRATLYDVRIYQSKAQWRADRRYHFASDEFSGKKYGFMLKRAKPFSVPIPHKGSLGLFDVEIGSSRPKDESIASEIFDEEYRTQWINHH